MAGNFIVLRPFVYVPGALILSAQNNTNEGNIYAAHNAAFNNVTGHQHTGAVGDGGAPLGPGSLNLAGNYPWTGDHSWSAPGTAVFNNGLTINGGGTWNGSPVLVTPTIASFTNAQHNHQNAAGGGTLDAAAISTGILPVVRGGTGVNTSTGTGSVVLNISPTLTTPSIGDFTNANHNHENAAGGGTISILNATTGTLTVARGGTGVTTSTGSGSVVLNNSPTLITPTIADFTNAQHNHQNAAGGGTLDTSAIATGILPIARGGTGSGAVPSAGLVIYSDGAAYVGSANHFWDNTNQRLGIGTSSPATDIHVSKSGADVELRLQRTASAGNSTLTLNDGSDVTTFVSNGSLNFWRISRGNTYIRGDDNIDCIEYASNSNTQAFGTVRIYTSTLSTNLNVGGSLLNFSISNATWLACKLTIIISWQDAGGSKSRSVDTYFNVFRNGAGVKGIGGPGGNATADYSNHFFAYGGDVPTGIQNPFSDATVSLYGAGAGNPPNFPSGTDARVGEGAASGCVAGALPQTLFPSTLGGNTNSLLFTDAGGELINIAYTAQTVGAPAGNAVRVTARLETLLSEYI